MLLLWWIIIPLSIPLQIILDVIWHHNRRGYQRWFIMWRLSSEVNLLKASFSRATATRRDVCVVVDSTLAAPLRVLGSCRLMRALHVLEGVAELGQRVSFNRQCLYPLSGEYCISSDKHLLWRVQGPLYSEHLFSPKWFCYWALLAHIRAGSGLNYHLSALLWFLLTCFCACRTYRLAVIFGHAAQTRADICQNYLEILEFLCRRSITITVTVPGVTLTGIWSIFSCS